MTDLLQIPRERYHANPRIGHSTLRLFGESRVAARDRLLRPATSASATSSLTHIALLEPERLNQWYVSQYATRCKSMRKEEEENPGRTVVTQAEMDEAVALAEAVERNPATWRLLNELTHKESTAFWTDARSGLMCKARPDGLIEGARVMLDLKAVRDHGTFVRDYLNDRWLGGRRAPGYCATQFGHYTTGVGGEWKCGVLLVVKSPSPEAGVVWLTDRTVKLGAQWVSDQLLELGHCQDEKIPWATPWARWEQEYDIEDGLEFCHEQITTGGKKLEGL